MKKKLYIKKKDPNIKKCCCCGKQIFKTNNPKLNTKYLTTSIGTKHGCCGDIICGHCAKDLDENGLFPEERMQLGLD